MCKYKHLMEALKKKNPNKARMLEVVLMMREEMSRMHSMVKATHQFQIKQPVCYLQPM